MKHNQKSNNTNG